MLTTPQPIHVGGKNRLPAAVGIGAARFHSLFWTRDALYTWGLNAGQVGHVTPTALQPNVVIF